MSSRVRVGSDGPWEERVGYSRAVRVDDRVWVSGTTGTHRDGAVPEPAQARLAFDTIASAREAAGSALADVVRARFFVVDLTDWDAIVPVVRERLGNVRPAMTMVRVARLIDPRHRVEIEVDAVVGSA